MDPTTAAVILLGVMFVMLAFGVWIGISLAAVGYVAMALLSTRPIGLNFGSTLWSANTSWALTALPMFIWMGEILFRTRLAEQMFAGLAPWLDKLPGRLLHVNVLGCGIFGCGGGAWRRLREPQIHKAAPASTAPRKDFAGPAVQH
jgi:TRAP-type mannitol/chloroaromatic compound transport system permease large subunit